MDAIIQRTEKNTWQTVYVSQRETPAARVVTAIPPFHFGAQVAEEQLAPGCRTSPLLHHRRSHKSGTAEEQGHVAQLPQLHGTVNRERAGSAASIGDVASLEQCLGSTCPPFFFAFAQRRCAAQGAAALQVGQLYGAGSQEVPGEAGAEQVWEPEYEVGLSGEMELVSWNSDRVA